MARIGTTLGSPRNILAPTAWISLLARALLRSREPRANALSQARDRRASLEMTTDSGQTTTAKTFAPGWLSSLKQRRPASAWPSERPLHWAVTGVVWGCCLWAILTWAYVAFSRVGYPYELEWMEGGVLGHVDRILQGKPIYQAPAAEFTPFLYAPLYYYFAAVATWLFGVGLPALRAVSVASTCVTLLLLYALVRKETGSRTHGMLAAGIYAATFERSAMWFDVARIDSCALALGLGGLYLALNATRLRGVAFAGLLLALATLTKQTAVVLAPVLFLWSWRRWGWRGAAAFAGTLVGVGISFTAIMTWLSDGWYWYYTVELPLSHGNDRREFLIVDFWRQEMFATLPILVSGALLMAFGFPTLTGGARHWTIVLGALSLVLGSYASRLHMGSYYNDLMPAHLALAWVFPIAAHGWGGALSGLRALRARSAALGLTALQLYLLIGTTDKHIPTQEDRATGDALVAYIRAQPGDVLVVNHPHLAKMAGKIPRAHFMAMIDVMLTKKDPHKLRDRLRSEWVPLFERKHFSTIIADNDWHPFWPELARHYRVERKLERWDKGLTPKTGTDFRPALVLVPK